MPLLLCLTNYLSRDICMPGVCISVKAEAASGQSRQIRREFQYGREKF